jgi:hypothetical protein
MPQVSLLGRARQVRKSENSVDAASDGKQGLDHRSREAGPNRQPPNSGLHQTRRGGEGGVRRA